MVITWSPLTLEQAQGFIIGYDISYQPTNSRKRQVLSVRVPGNSNEFTIMGLDPALSYTAAVSAATAVGVGPASPPVTPTGMMTLCSIIITRLAKVPKYVGVCFPMVLGTVFLYFY